MRLSILFAAALWLVSAACNDDVPAGTTPLVQTDSAADAVSDTGTVGDTVADAPPDTAADAGPDSVSDTAPDTTADSGGDTSPDTGSDTGADTVADTGPDTATDTGPDTDTVVPPDLSDWDCDTALRVAACEEPLLNDGAAPPLDGSDPLFYVNRAYAIPADFPISDSSTWTPCSGGDPNVDHDLVCVPLAYRTKPVALREVAWDAPAPAQITETFDGLPVGHVDPDGSVRVGYRALFDAAWDEVGAELFVASGYRSYATQEATFDFHTNNEKNTGLTLEEAILSASTFSAQPGHSEHQLGTTVDMVYKKDNGVVSSFGRKWAEEMAASWQMQWVFDNAHRFGVVLTYGRDKIAVTQYVWEPWHWRYVGVEAANAMRSCELNTEEFLNARYDAGPLPPYAGDPLILIDGVAQIDASHTGTQPADAGEALVRSWTLENAGTSNWDDYVFAHVAGEDFGGGDVDLPCTPVTEATSVTMDLVAPATDGLHVGSWQVLTSEGVVADPLTFEVRVFVGDPAGSTLYRYVRIDDLSGASGGADPGADIDAVVLTRAGTGEQVLATAVSYYEAAPASVSNDNPADALGEPDAFYAWPGDATVCGVSGGFVSLGGGGTLIVELAESVQPGDTLTVLEVGACEYDPGKSAIPDEIQVRVATEGTLGASWEPVGTGDGGAVSLEVPFLP